MAKLQLSNGQDIVVLDYAGDYYLNNSAVTVGSTFTLSGQTIIPMVDECESDGDQKVEITPSVYVTDNNGNRYVFIVGGRPKTRTRA